MPELYTQIYPYSENIYLSAHMLMFFGIIAFLINLVLDDTLFRDFPGMASPWDGFSEFISSSYMISVVLFFMAGLFFIGAALYYNAVAIPVTNISLTPGDELVYQTRTTELGGAQDKWMVVGWFKEIDTNGNFLFIKFPYDQNSHPITIDKNSMYSYWIAIPENKAKQRFIPDKPDLPGVIRESTYE